MSSCMDKPSPGFAGLGFFLLRLDCVGLLIVFLVLGIFTRVAVFNSAVVAALSVEYKIASPSQIACSARDSSVGGVINGDDNLPCLVNHLLVNWERWLTSLPSCTRFALWPRTAMVLRL